MKPLIFSLLILFCVSCSTMRNGSTQQIPLRSNVTGVKVYTGFDSLYVGGKDTLLELSRAMPVVLRLEKEGYTPQVVKLKQQYNPAIGSSMLAFTSMFTPFLFLDGAAGPDEQGKAALIGVGVGLGVYMLANGIDVASGSRMSLVPAQVECTLYPAARYQYTARTAMRCSSVSYRPWYLGTQEKLPPEIAPDRIKEAIDVTMAGSGMQVPGQGFNKDTAGRFTIQLIIDSMDVLVHDETSLSRIVFTATSNGQYMTGEGVVIPAETQTIYTDVRLKLSWKITDNASGRWVIKDTNVRQVHYALGVVKAWYATLQTSMVQLLNHDEVHGLLEGESD